MLILVYFIYAFGGVLGAEWTYISGDTYGPTNWNKVDATCGLRRQSPINIQTASVVHDSSLGAFSFKGYDTAQPNALFDINNNGHAVGVALSTEPNKVPPEIEISGGGLSAAYVLAQFHFHWGEDDTHGSEHRSNNDKYAAELHLVHYKKAYGSLANSLQHGDGLAVIGVYIEVGGSANAGFTEFTNNLKHVLTKDKSKTIPEYAISSMLPANRKDYYRYLGSLTTPPCSEAVVWTVFKDSVSISHDQMKEFRTVRDDKNKPIDNNYRPPQALNGRTVYKSFKNGQPSHRVSCGTLLLVVLSTVALF